MTHPRTPSGRHLAASLSEMFVAIAQLLTGTRQEARAKTVIAEAIGSIHGEVVATEAGAAEQERNRIVGLLRDQYPVYPQTGATVRLVVLNEVLALIEGSGSPEPVASEETP